MGQYYYCCDSDTLSYVHPRNTGNGLKLLEHAYIDSTMLLIVESLLRPGGQWYMHKIMWVGDYGDPVDGEDNRYELCSKKGERILGEFRTSKHWRYLVNHDKKQFVDKKPLWEKGARLHPLPILCIEYSSLAYFEGNTKVGSWAGERISVEDEVPEGYEEVVCNFDEDLETYRESKK